MKYLNFKNCQKLFFVFAIISILLIPSLVVHAADSQAVTWVKNVLNFDLSFGVLPWLEEKLAIPTPWEAAGGVLEYSLRPVSWGFAKIGALFSGIAGIFFDWMAALSFGADLGNGSSIYKMTTSDGGVIALGWSILRDLVNVIFIFIVIYIGIMTILGILSGDLKKLLMRIILAAIFINFSLLLTGLVIDASNVLAIGFYNAFPESEDLKWLVTTLTPPDSRSLSLPMAKTTGLSASMGTAVHTALTTGDGTPSSSGADNGKGTLNNFVVGILLFMAGFIMITAGFLLLTRTLVLIMLMVLSPLAIAAYALPSDKGKTYFNTWKNHLIHHSFWAPAFMVMYYLAVQMAQNFSIVNAASGGGGAFSTLVILIVNVSITLGLMWSSIVISKKLADYGNASIGKLNKRLLGYRDKTGGFAGRHTVGRMASAISDSERMKKLIARNPRLGGMLLRPIDYTSKASFGGKKGGYEKVKDDRVEQQVKLYKKLAKDKTGEDLIVEERETGRSGTRVVKNPQTGETTFVSGPILENVTAQRKFIENLGKQRKPIWTRQPSLSGTFKQETDKESTVVSQKVTNENLAEMRSRYGDDVKEGETVRIRTTVGGRQTRVDRETLLKIKKESGKNNWDKLKDELESTAKKEVEETQAPASPPPASPPTGGGTTT